MSKESIKAREVKRNKLVARYAAKREALRKAGNWTELDKLPRNSSKVRLRNRCMLTGRPRGYLRQFGLSRLMFRKMALEGKIAGITKSSW